MPETTTAPTTPVDPREVLADTLQSADLSEPFSRGQLADMLLAALSAAGCVVSAPQDLEWGTCPQSETGTHYVSLGLCSGCLEYDPE